MLAKTSLIRFAQALARGSKMKRNMNIMKERMSCIAYSALVMIPEKLMAVVEAAPS